MVSIAERALEFGARPENSARSVLVTILGDSIVPLGGEVWLGDLISLMEPFGYSERLVRTSVFRLTAEGWIESDRIGRRSRYRLTEFARREFAVAEERIYDETAAEWSGEWTLVFSDLAATSRQQRRLVHDHLRWAGFATLTTGVQAVPGDGIVTVRELEQRLQLAEPLPVASARFEDLAPLVGNGRLAEIFGLSDAAERYSALVARFGSGDTADFGTIAGRDAFVVRTMLVHDLRRAALVDPRLPGELLPAEWIGAMARQLAADVYRAVARPAWRWLEHLTGLRAATTDRF